MGGLFHTKVKIYKKFVYNQSVELSVLFNSQTNLKSSGKLWFGPVNPG